jgi:hypothetical protein
MEECHPEHPANNNVLTGTSTNSQASLPYSLQTVDSDSDDSADDIPDLTHLSDDSDDEIPDLPRPSSPIEPLPTKRIHPIFSVTRPTSTQDASDALPLNDHFYGNTPVLPKPPNVTRFSSKNIHHISSDRIAEETTG